MACTDPVSLRHDAEAPRHGSAGPAHAPVEQRPPLGLLNGHCDGMAGVVRRRMDRLAQIDEGKRVPAGPGQGEQLPVRRLIARDGVHLDRQRVVQPMPADAAVPVLRIRKIPLAAVHDRVPPGSFRRRDPLAQGVALGQEIVPQPQARLDGLIQLLIDLRKQAREEKNYARSDQIRNQLKALGVTLEDRPDGTFYRLE